MRIVKTVLLVSVCVAVLSPIAILFLLCGIAFIGGVANANLESKGGAIAGVTNISQRVPTEETSQLKIAGVQLEHSENVTSQEALAVREVLNSRVFFGEIGTQSQFRLDRNEGMLQMQILPSMPRELCETSQPLWEIFATLVSHHCFHGEPFEVILLPENASDAIACVSRSDVKNCLFNGSQSVFFDTTFGPELMNTIRSRLEAIGFLGTDLEPANYFIRELAAKTQISQFGSVSGIAAIAPEHLAVTLRDRALLYSLVVSCGVDCEYRLTDAKFENVIRSFDMSFPFQPVAVAGNGCFLVIADASIPQETVDAIALRLAPIPGRELKVDIWLRRVGSEVVAMLPVPIFEGAMPPAMRRTLYATGLAICSELPADCSVAIHGCDGQFQSLGNLSVNERDGAYVARDDCRLVYTSDFDKAFANQLADYFVRCNAFSFGSGCVMKLSGTGDAAKTPRLVLSAIPHQPTSDEVTRMETFGKSTADSMFTSSGLQFEVCDVYGERIEPLFFQFPSGPEPFKPEPPAM